MKIRSSHSVAMASVLIAASLRAQGIVTGKITDSVSHRPLAGALVQMIADSSNAAKSTTSDSLGVFRIEGVTPGSYIIGFFHSTLDSLGIDLTPKRVIVRGGEQQVELAIPSAPSILRQLCPTSTPRDSTGLFLGHIRDAESRQPRAGTVTVLWMELVIGGGGVRRNRQQIPIKSDDIGWFAMCGLPSDVDLEASAQAGDEQSGVIELRVPTGGLVVRDFLVSRADSTIAIYEENSATAAKKPLATLRRGSARVSGTVHNDKGKPVSNAEVSVPGTGVDARTQDAGTFTLGGLPSGTQTLEVRALGFEPKRVPVDLTRSGLTTLDVVLDRPVQTLDVVKVYGTGNASLAAFNRRRRAGWGHFLTPADIAKRNAFQVSDLFRMMPGVRVAPSGGFGNTILVRGCRPTVYLNGMRMDDDAASEIDFLATPQEITGVEVYGSAARPAEFWGNSCGSVVLWAGMLPR